MDKRLTIEGSPAAKMVQLMRKYGHNREVSIETATVVTVSPLSVKLSDGIVLNRSDLVLTETASTRSWVVGDKAVVIGDNDTQFYYVIDRTVI